jgi:septin family protein
MNPEINEFNAFSTEPTNENKDLTIDLNMLAVSFKEIQNNLNVYDFEDFLEVLCEANDKGKFLEYLEQVRLIHSEGTDLASAISHAQFDLLLDPGEDFIID